MYQLFEYRPVRYRYVTRSAVPAAMHTVLLIVDVFAEYFRNSYYRYSCSTSRCTIIDLATIVVVKCRQSIPVHVLLTY